MVLTTLTQDEFIALIEKAIDKKLGCSNKPAPVIEVINRTELKKRLDITEPTVIRYEKKGKIPCFHIGSSVRYNWHEVINSLEGKKKEVRRNA